jgi:hypothetical protein
MGGLSGDISHEEYQSLVVDQETVLRVQTGIVRKRSTWIVSVPEDRLKQAKWMQVRWGRYTTRKGEQYIVKHMMPAEARAERIGNRVVSFTGSRRGIRKTSGHGDIGRRRQVVRGKYYAEGGVCWVIRLGNALRVKSASNSDDAKLRTLGTTKKKLRLEIYSKREPTIPHRALRVF